MAFIPVLSHDDVRLLKELVTAYKGGRLNAPSRTGEPPDDHQAPETYIAIPVDEEGIPAMEDAVGTGTGTGIEEGDRPGYADCDIYRIEEGETHDSLVKIGIAKKVYNLNSDPITQSWIPVTRDKFGSWLVVGGGIGVVPYLIVEQDEDFVGTGEIGTAGGEGVIPAAVYRTSHQFDIDQPGTGTDVETRYGFRAIRAERDGLGWQYKVGFEVEYIISDGLGGVCFTGQHCFAAKIAGEFTWVSGPSGHFFKDCVMEENVIADAEGEVSINFEAFEVSTTATVTAINKTGNTVFEGQTVSLLFDDLSQQFTIVLPGCST